MGPIKTGGWRELAHGLCHSDFLMGGSKLSCGHESSNFTWAAIASTQIVMNQRESQSASQPVLGGVSTLVSGVKPCAHIYTAIAVIYSGNT